MASKSKYILNFFINAWGLENLFFDLIAYLSFADLDLLFLSTSFFEGLNTLFLYSSKRASESFSFSGKYLEGFDLFIEKFLKKNFTIFF